MFNSLKRHFNLIYDGQCAFCRASLRHLQSIDVFNVIIPVDYHKVTDLKSVHPDLTKEMTQKEIYLVDDKYNLWGGFYAFRRLSLNIPILWILIPIVYFPGIGILGSIVYSIIARNRKYFPFKESCQNDACST